MTSFYDKKFDYIVNILKEQPKLPNISKFLDYFTNTYFEGDFDVKSWIHFSTAGPRTNNNMEGYNAKLKKHVGVAHPNIYKAIQFFQTEEVAAHFKYLAANKGDKPPPRNKLVILKGELLPQYKKMLMDGDISLDIYLKYVMPLYDINEKNKKKATAARVGSSEESLTSDSVVISDEEEDEDGEESGEVDNRESGDDDEE